jgi:hypothetical protein
MSPARKKNVPEDGTWCRAHKVYDACPETCWICNGYFHEGVACEYAAATDGGGPMPLSRWSDYGRRLYESKYRAGSDGR